MVSSLVTRLFYMEPVHIGSQHQYLHVAPRVVEPVRLQVFNIFVSNFHTNCVHLPKVMVVPHCTEASLLMICIPQQPQDRQSATEKSLSSDEQLFALVHDKPAEDQEA